MDNRLRGKRLKGKENRIESGSQEPENGPRDIIYFLREKKKAEWRAVESELWQSKGGTRYVKWWIVLTLHCKQPPKHVGR